MTTRKKKIAYLTFDDGPTKVTYRILDLLDHYRASATFFMLESRIRRFPSAVERMVEEGHTLGLHGVTHSISQFYASKHSVVQEFDQTRRTIKRITGKDTTLARTPHGSRPYMKASYLKAVNESGYQLWDWNVDSLDWKYRDERMVHLITKQVIQLERRHKNPVILMHDRLDETADFLETILIFLIKKGYELEKLTPSMKPILL
ncbi:polysaccharide deacetylase [Paenibacillus sp. N1-5-1-14]|uniref:polysaccharide deacetylase family protein n=1 Tax=Paenibacillus radicibacter TaxID=2972488 RepID=UPI0021593349|nr:polysaccharide deacetylase family protein [Paenibacillus radicibacter]MCR8644262.1 polysaccharide deacetylase [Paenibacillus radicibacter]